MRIIIIGAGRLGRALGILWKNQHEIVFFDRDEKVAHEAAAELGVEPAAMQKVLEKHVRAHLDELAEVRPDFR